MNDTAPQPSTGEQPDYKLVPEFWPPADPIEPVKTWRIPWLLAPLAAIPAVLLPRRVGPHLANSNWAAAYIAHVFSGFVMVGTIFAVGTEYQSGGEPTLASVFLFNPFVELAPRWPAPSFSSTGCGTDGSRSWGRCSRWR